MYTTNIENISMKELPKRKIRVLIGEGSPISSEFMTFGKAYVAAKTKMDPHKHDNEEEIIFILKGNGFLEIAGELEEIKPGTVMLIPPGKEHLINNESDEELQFVFCFNSKLIIGTYDGK